MLQAIDDFDGEHRFLSNFYPSPMMFQDGEDMYVWPLSYNTVEHGFQAAKAATETAARRIASATRPGEAKRLGRSVALRPGWDVIKFPVMATLLRKKFQDPELKEKLLQTSPVMLIEGNTWHDQIWGDCTCGRISCTLPGENHLGHILMKIRRELLATARHV